MTPEQAAENAAQILQQAAEVGTAPARVAALVQVADGWTRLHTALANAPKTIEPVSVNIDKATIRDLDWKKIAEEMAAARGSAPKPEPEVGVYSERARLIAYLAAGPYTAKIAYNDPAEPDWPVIYIDTPRGQLSWHLSRDDLHLFEHVPVVEPHEAEWDGHSTVLKYERLAALVRDVNGMI